VDPKLITPVLIAALVVWGIYRRLRRSFGRQEVHVGRIWFRICLFALVGVLVLAGAARDLATLAGLLAGAAGGAALGYIGLRHTQFEVTAQGRFYTPHTYIGLVVSALFIGRILYRLLSGAYLYSAQAAAAANQNPFQAYGRSPLTLAIFGALVGYYLVFYLGVLQKTKAPTGTAPGVGGT
jgi:hypothetical protein